MFDKMVFDPSLFKSDMDILVIYLVKILPITTNSNVFLISWKAGN